MNSMCSSIDPKLFVGLFCILEIKMVHLLIYHA
jgi:hypothetical protein